MKRQTDWMRKDNAERLARQIQTYWAERGRTYKVWAEPILANEQGDRHVPVYCIRSNIKFRAYPDFYGNNIENP